MCDLLIFGGTTEGRLLAEFCIRHQIHALISVTSDYGKDLLTEHQYLTVRVGAMDEREMTEFMGNHGVRLVVDATHPYAVDATVHIKEACSKTGASYIRCVRSGSGDYSENVITVETEAEAVAFLEQTEGNVFLTTGSKRLPAFCALTDFRERLYARVLPSLDIMEQCEQAGFPSSHLICMQGPFSEALNTAMLRQTRARFLVTKEAGRAGGFEEKLSAARACDCRVIVIKRKEQEEGLPLAAVRAKLLVWKDVADKNPKEAALSVTLAGAGPGDAGQITEAVREAIRECDTVLAAPRILDTVRLLPEGAGKILLPYYLPEQVEQWLDSRAAGIGRVIFLFSGDTGFYSGAVKIKTLFEQRQISCRILPGISSVAYFAARLGIVWQDAGFYTAHGRVFDAAAAIRAGERKMFLLLGGENGAGRLCETLCINGFGHVQVSVGERLSYPDERIKRGRADALQQEVFGPLSLMLIEEEE